MTSSLFRRPGRMKTTGDQHPGCEHIQYPRILTSAFPYATKYGTPGWNEYLLSFPISLALFLSESTLCPPVTRDQTYKLQLFPADCNGVTLLSRSN